MGTIIGPMKQCIFLLIQIILLVSLCLLSTGCAGKDEPAPEASVTPEPDNMASVWDSSTSQTRDTYERRGDSTGQGTEDDTYAVTGSEETRGDCDGDGEITTSDALCALQMAVGKNTEDLVMDINGDGRVSSVDVRKVLRNALGLDVLK